MTDDLLYVASVNDVCAFLGLTRRQITHWETMGAFVPESRYRKYTPADVEQLTRLKAIIVNERCPVHLARELMLGR